jgi:autotransporter-associated beta strand protein
LLLAGTNTYSGITTLSSGLVYVETASPFGPSGAGTELTGGDLSLRSVTVNDEPLTNSSTASALQVDTTYSATWGSNVVLNANLAVDVASAGVLDLAGRISGANDLIKSQPGTLIFSGSIGNSQTGDTIVNGGLLELSKSTAPAINSGLLVVGDGVGAGLSDVVRCTAANQFFTAVQVFVSDTGYLDLNGFSDTVSAITLVGGNIATGAGTLTMNDNLTASSGPIGGGSVITGNLNLGGASRTFTVTNGPSGVDFLIAAIVSNSGLELVKAGDGRMELSGANTFAGAVAVNAGTLDLTDNLALGTTAGGTTVNGTAQLRLLNGAHIGLEALTLNSTLPGGALEASGSSNSWAGTITLAANTIVDVASATTLNLTGSIGGSGGLTKIGDGSLYYSGGAANNYAGITAVNAGTLVLAKSILGAAMTNNLVIGDGSGGGNADVVRLEILSQLPNTLAVQVNSSGLFDLNDIGETFGSLSGSGNVDLGTGLINPGNDDDSTTFSGVITGAGQVIKGGLGVFTLTGNNTYSGLTTINEGQLIINGFQQASAVNVGSVGVLGGTGSVGAIINTNGGVVAPGTSPGILIATNLSLSGPSSDFTVELNGTTAGPGFDRVDVFGPVSLGGATLNVLTAFNPLDAPALGEQFILIDKVPAGAVVGTFNGRADNSTFTINNLTFRIDYDGGTGNDVVLTLTNVPAAEAGVIVSSGNGNAVAEGNECILVSVVVTNRTGSAMLGVTGHLRSATPGVSVVQSVVNYPDVPATSRRTNAVPFQVSIAPNLICGTNINLNLVLETATHSTFSLPVTLPTGAAGTTLAFTNSTPQAIADGGTLDVPIVVSGVPGLSFKVTAQIYITHSQTADLDVTLESPDGTIVELTTDNGGGANYGINCGTSRTVFDDAAGTPITAGTVPFVGTFRPEGLLSNFRGRTANGNWILHVTDDSINGIAGTFQCAVVTIQSATCVAGGGICELCPSTVVSGYLGSGSGIQTNRLIRSGLPSVCGIPTNCPGVWTLYGNRLVDAYTFLTGSSNACISVTVQTVGADLGSAAYLGSFDPLNICNNYLGGSATSTADVGGNMSYSFDAPANSVFVLTVTEVDSGGGPYVMTVSGGDCRPVLNIGAASATQARLNWSTASTGYRLERTNHLTGAAGAWQSVATVPVVVNSKFTVTNNVSATNQFYRLVKP